MEQECRRTAQAVARFELVVEDRQPGLERVTEPFLFAGEHAHQEIAVLHDVGVRVAHHVDRGLHEARHDELLGSEQECVPHGAADDPAQHVAAALVRRKHAVADEHRRRAGVLGEHAHREAVAVVVVARDAVLPGDRLGRLDQRCHEVGLPDRVDPLE